MRLTIEPEEVEAAVLEYVKSKLQRPGADIEIVRFTRAQGTGQVRAEVSVAPGQATILKEDE